MLLAGVIERTGGLTNLAILVSSGQEHLDRLPLEAVRQVALQAGAPRRRTGPGIQLDQDHVPHSLMCGSGDACDRVSSLACGGFDSMTDVRSVTSRKSTVAHGWLRRGFLLWTVVSMTWLANSVRIREVPANALKKQSGGRRCGRSYGADVPALISER